MSNTTYLAIQAVLYPVPAFLHFFGLYLLITIKNLGPAEDQRAFLIHLSISESGFCFSKMAHRFLFLFGYDKIALKVWIFQTGFFFTELCLIMDLLTLDRFLAVHLNITYKTYITKQRVNLCIAASWLLSTIVFLISFLVVDIKDVVNLFIFFIWPIVEYSFLLIAIPVYVYIFIKVNNNRYQMKMLKKNLSLSIKLSDPITVIKSSTSSSSDLERRRRALLSFSAAKEKIKKKTFVPFLLITTFLSFWLIPDQIQFVLMITTKHIPSEVHFASNILYIVATFCDSLIYIIGTPKVREFLKQRKKSLKSRSRNTVELKYGV